jgi:hypothetical protein
MYRKSLIFLLTFLSLNSTAAPTVTSAILDNGTLTINGSSFGSQNPMIFGMMLKPVLKPKEQGAVT